ncbi:hypothetical protein JOD57_000035 [Geodermatophilus bullaregiensis]|uniref:hypothetical protein n=1 Tax=Geodermatophilus bullaregiensis TaxID=1564160 RepID=UPI0019569518|nr:hypothetical protein [Geodermatophilus bullaregiensis]MBM7804198.1 hypothetical protein [Geodermatophilus bullaregiensis]
MAKALRQWLAWPEILADPLQTAAEGVWTRADEILPGVLFRPGTIVIAAWGETIWHGRVHWDYSEIDLLWVESVGEPITVPDPAVAYDVEALATRIADLAAERLAHSERSTSAARGAVREAASASLEGVMADFRATLAEAVAAGRRDRAAARDALGLLNDLPAKQRQRILGAPAASGLFRLARLAAPPGREH